MSRDLLRGIDWNEVISSLGIATRLESPGRAFRAWMEGHTHVHNYDEVVINLSGEHLCGADGNVAFLSPGTALILPRGMPHDKWYGSVHAKCIDFWIHLLPSGPVTMGFVIHDPASELVLLPVPLPTGQAFPKFDYLSELFSDSETFRTVFAAKKRDFYLLYYLSALFEQLRQMDFLTRRIDESAIIRGVTKYMIDNLTESLTLNDLAKAAGYSPFHFHRMFVKSKGMTPRLFIEKKRLELARSLLMQNQSVTAAAFNSGFTSSSQFSQIFKKHLQLTPREWVNSLQK